MDEKNNCKILSPNDFFCTDGNNSSVNINIDGIRVGRSTSYIEGYKHSRTWPWELLKKHFQWGGKIDGPNSAKIRADLDKWVANLTNELNKTHTISYRLNGGKVSGNPKRYKFTSKTFKLKNPTRKGYTFLGWVAPGEKTPRKNVTIKQFKLKKDLLFVAKWAKK